MTGRPDLDALLPLSPTVFHVLVAVAREPRHGYAIAQEVEELTEGRVTMGPGTLYGSLKRMSDAGLISEVDNPGEPGGHAGRRRYYGMTTLGEKALRAESARLSRAVGVARERMGT